MTKKQEDTLALIFVGRRSEKFDAVHDVVDDLTELDFVGQFGVRRIEIGGRDGLQITKLGRLLSQS